MKGGVLDACCFFIRQYSGVLEWSCLWEEVLLEGALEVCTYSYNMCALAMI